MTRAIAFFVAVIVALGGIVIAVSSDNGNPNVTVTVGKPTGATELTVPKAAVDQAKESDVAHHNGLRSEAPPGVTPREFNANERAQEAAAQVDQLPLVTPLAASTQRGCITNNVVNQSSRRGVSPKLLVAHYTVSRNRAGWSDVNAIVSLFNTSSFQASSNYVIDHEGLCKYIVPEANKAWTQAAANPWAISIEMIAMGTPSIDGSWGGSAGLAKAALVFADAAKRWHIPVQHGAVNSSCVPTRSGIVEHADLGGCGGGHHDIRPYPISQLIDAVQHAGGPTTPPVSEHAKKLCRELKKFRDRKKAKGHLDAYGTERVRKIKAALGKVKHGYRYHCSAKGVCTKVKA